MDLVQQNRATNKAGKTPSNIFGYGQSHPLDAFFAPKSVAVIGASTQPGSVGRTVLWNLLSNPFGGIVYPVNTSKTSVMGIKSYPDVTAIAEPVDLAVIATPARTVPGIISQCAEAGVKGAIVISAGFKECGSGTEGERLEQEVLEQARLGKMRVIGPNCLGLMCPVTGLNATFASAMALPGNVAFISQSGALCTAVLDWSIRENVGFSAFVSIGSMLDISWGDLIDYLGDDPHTKSIVIYMESIGNARAFLSAAREVALTKPVIVIKAGHTQEAAKAAASHTGALTGSDEVLDVAFRRSGVLRVDNIGELFYMAEVLAMQPYALGKRLTILTNAGGPGVLATDALVTGGGELAPLPPETVAAFNELLPPHWSRNNPVDILGDATPERYGKAFEIALKNPESDGLLVVLTPQAMTDPTSTAEQLKPFSKSTGKPILASWMGGTAVASAESVLQQASIPTFPYPDIAARVFNHMWRFKYNLDSLYETPILTPGSELEAARREEVTSLIEEARKTGRTVLSEYESKQVLSAYNIPTVETRLARSEDEAVRLAKALTYPVVLKLHSHTITHKTDVGGVALNLLNAEEVRKAFRQIEASVKEKAGSGHFLGVTVQSMVRAEGYELILGSSIDPQFGPVLLFGSGGQLVEVYQDRALALPPLNTTLARRMLEETRVFKALKGVRGRAPVDLQALEELLVQFSYLVVEQRWIKEIDLNPLLASPRQLLALDARIILHDPDKDEKTLPNLAIRPYPSQYTGKWALKNGAEVTIRPIRPEDEPLLVKFHRTLSDRSVYFRYFHMIGLDQRVAHERLRRICFIDYDREIALVAEQKDPDTGERSVIGVGRLSKLHATNEAELAVLICDQYQGQGLGSELTRRIIQIARDEKLDRLVGDIHPENQIMKQLCEKLGFQLRYSVEEQVIQVKLELK